MILGIGESETMAAENDELTVAGWYCAFCADRDCQRAQDSAAGSVEEEGATGESRDRDYWVCYG